MNQETEQKKQSFLKYLYKKHQEPIDTYLSTLILFPIPVAGLIICIFFTDFLLISFLVMLGLLGLEHLIIKICLEYSEYRTSVHAQSTKEASA